MINEFVCWREFIYTFFKKNLFRVYVAIDLQVLLMGIVFFFLIFFICEIFRVPH